MTSWVFAWSGAGLTLANGAPAVSGDFGLIAHVTNPDGSSALVWDEAPPYPFGDTPHAVTLQQTFTVPAADTYSLWLNSPDLGWMWGPPTATLDGTPIVLIADGPISGGSSPGPSYLDAGYWRCDFAAADLAVGSHELIWTGGPAGSSPGICGFFHFWAATDIPLVHRPRGGQFHFG
jgi:hypothetical protein